MRAWHVFGSIFVLMLIGNVSDLLAQPASSAAIQAEVETVYTLSDGREVRNHGRLFRSRFGQVREDSSLGALITDTVAGTVTMLVSETKEARVFRIPAGQIRQPLQSNRPVPDVFEEATHNGRRVAKARMQGPRGQRVEFWTAKDLGVVTWSRTEANGLIATRELRNLSTEEPDPALFAIPPDYAVIEQDTRPSAVGGTLLPPRPPRQVQR